MAHYCTSPNRNTTHIGMPSITGTDDVYLSKYVAEVVGKFGSEAKIVRIMSDGGGNLLVFRVALDSKYINDSFFHHPRPSSPWSALRIYWRGLARRECNLSSIIMVRLTPN